MSNLYSVLLARYHFFPEVKTKGMTALPRLILFTSAHVRITSIHVRSCLFILSINMY
jgi:hypothetical protein